MCWRDVNARGRTAYICLMHDARCRATASRCPWHCIHTDIASAYIAAREGVNSRLGLQATLYVCRFLCRMWSGASESRRWPMVLIMLEVPRLPPVIGCQVGNGGSGTTADGWGASALALSESSLISRVISICMRILRESGSSTRCRRCSSIPG